jgi:predicted AAA+ superfamily ATPase
LAGRIYTLELSPLTLPEVETIMSAKKLWLRGGFPPSLLARADDASFRWRANYLRDITERDLRIHGFNIQAARIRQFLAMLAHQHGQLWNGLQLARSLEISVMTVNRYAQALRELFLVRTLASFHKNLGKRLVKSPKIYLRDSGLLHSVLGIKNSADLWRHPASGFSWESFVIEQIAACLSEGWELAFWRTAAGAEIDLLLVYGADVRAAIEIKSGLDPKIDRGFYQGCQDLQPEFQWIIYGGEKVLPLSKPKLALPLAQALKRIKKLCA